MSWRTLLRWTSPRSLRARPALVPVEVVAEERDGGRPLAIVTRAGHRIEGIALADAIAFVRELG